MFHLAWFLAGANAQGWGQPGSGRIGRDWRTPDLYVELARTLERACFDFILLEDNVYVPDAYQGAMDIYLRKAISTPRLDPMMMAPHMLGATRRIGIVPTVSTFAYHPYLLARQLGSLDTLSGGRAGWNVVTGSSDRAVQNFGFDRMLPHDERYDAAAEFVDVATALWESWAPDSVLADEATGTFADPSKVHTIEHRGKYYASRGPLNSGPAPQGAPVLAQAGSSPRGRQFAAQYADTVVGDSRTPAGMKSYRDDMHVRMREFGRDPGECKLLFSISPIVAPTMSQAQDMLEVTKQSSLENAEALLAQLAKMTSIDFGRFPLDEPLSAEGLETNGTQKTLVDFVEHNQGRTLREAAAANFGQYAGNLGLVGTPDHVAGVLDELMQEVGGDGYFIGLANTNRGSVAAIADGLVPALQQRGAVRDGYDHELFRDNLRAF
jgi:FMN-dependent oxidoreductase (nitrilotriacetate monooxygenase family)